LTKQGAVFLSQMAEEPPAAFNGAYAARIGDSATQAFKKGQRRHP
jgi:hypothetical protein